MISGLYYRSIITEPCQLSNKQFVNSLSSPNIIEPHTRTDNKYKDFTKGAIIKHKFTEEVYAIIEGSESNELTLYNIWEQENYSTNIKIKCISKGNNKIKTT